MSIVTRLLQECGSSATSFGGSPTFFSCLKTNSSTVGPGRQEANFDSEGCGSAEDRHLALVTDHHCHFARLVENVHPAQGNPRTPCPCHSGS